MSKKFLIIASVVLVIAGLVLMWFYRGRIFNTAQDHGIRVARNLTKDQKKIYTDRIAKAESFLKSLDPNQPDYKLQAGSAHLYLGQQYYGLGEIGQAEKEYQTAFGSGEKNVETDICTALALAQTEGGDYTGARLSLEKARELSPQRPDIWLSYIVLVKDRFPENRQEIPTYYQEALLATKRHLDILTSYAQYLEQQGNIAGAREIWKEAMEKDPFNDSYKQEYQRLGGK